MQAVVSKAVVLTPQQREALHTQQQQPSTLCLVPARRRSERRSVTTAGFGAAAGFGAGVGSSGLGAAQMISSFLGCALAAAWVGFQLKQEQDAMEREGRRECESCGGTGRVPCICLKWSDRDVGCGACSGSGLMECTSCGGGGTAVPIEARVHITGRAQQRRDYY